MRNKVILSFFSISITLFSCDKNRVFDSYATVPKKWHKDSVITFTFHAPDTIHHYNLFINLRNTSDYKYNNIYLIAALKLPHGKTIIDTLQYEMANKKGEFLGTGFSDVKENKLWYKGHDTPFKFQENGEYEVQLQQAMRENGKVNGIVNLDGISDVGFRVEKPQEK